MTKIKQLSAFCLSLGCSSVLMAGTMGPAVKPESWYLVGGAGASWSQDADIRVDPAIWDPARQGYSSNLDSSALLIFGAGRYITDAFRIDARYEHRGDYNYSRFQTGVNNGVPGFTGDQRTRKFELDSNSLMVNGWLDLGTLNSALLWQAGSMSIQPYVGGGIGVDYLNVKNFRTIADPFGGNRNEIASINQTTTDSQFAWRVGAGLSAQLTSRTTLAVGYDYFDGGKIPFPDFILSSLSAPSGRTGVSVTPWRGSFTANEVYAELRVLF
ncbi:outer membrane protein [Legionella sp. CNM-4043-24]|uniref:outer membrane protein n=1 Tax=Legionella sp. CNM-4043-24 TaxID=3421646 RepID=UPI00403AB29C